MDGRAAPAPFSPANSGADGDAVLAVESISKLYPRTRLSLYPPLHHFHEKWFKRQRSSADGDAAAASAGDPALVSGAPAPQRDIDLEEELAEAEDEEDIEDLISEPSAGAPTTEDPGEMFWALRDISFRVAPGAALGVLGGPGAGKTALLNILGGGAFPTEGRVLVRGRVSPLVARLHSALSLTDKGTFHFNLRLAARLLGVDPRLVKRHEDQIEELSGPVRDANEDPLPGAFPRLAVATALVLPSSVIVLDEPKGLEEDFMERVVERLRGRIEGGTAVVYASRSPDLIQELCDEAIVLDKGSIADRGEARGVGRRYRTTAASGGGEGKTKAGGRPVTAEGDGQARPSQHLLHGRELDVPETVRPFNDAVALLSATLQSTNGRKRIDTAEEVSVEIRIETAVPGIEALCGVGFAPRKGNGAGIRFEVPEPVRFLDPGVYVVVGRVRPGTLGPGPYEVRADAVVAHPQDSEARVIGRSMGRVHIVGEGEGEDSVEPAVSHWDGSAWRRAHAEWSIE